MLYQNTIQSLKSYVKKYPEEGIQDLLSVAELNDQIIKRENLSGHITASGLVFFEDKLLLIFHKKLQRYLQPGGHLEDDKTLVDAAQREVLEETGVQTVPYKSEKTGCITPLHIDIHTIPPNEKKNESEHIHYDCMFLLFAQNSETSLLKSEVDGYKWVELDFAFKDKGIVDAVKKFKGLHSEMKQF